MGSRQSEWFLAQRPWTKAERRIVWRGLAGRSFIAIEPIILSLVFVILTVGLILERPRQEAMLLSPIFGSAALAFALYGVALMIEPVQALFHTFSPIYIVDGYVRYRKAHPFDAKAPAYVCVLNEKHRLLGEWPITDERAVDQTFPAMVEFTRYGGVHRIDGRSTGLLPNTLPPLGIGATSPEPQR